MSPDSDTSSIYTLPESLRESLYRTQGSRRFASLSEEYPWPCDSVAAQFEIVGAAVGDRIYRNGLYWEDQEGKVMEMMEREGGQARILDLGSGVTATWCVSMAEKFPSAEVTGIDLVPTELYYLPENLNIEIHDLLEGILTPNDYFDLIHMRFGGMTGFVDNPSAVDLISEIHRTLKPGGVVLFELMHDAANPFRTRVPSPIVETLRARLCPPQVSPDSPGKQTDFASQGALEADWVRRINTDSARFIEARTTSYELPMGLRPEEGAGEKQIGSLIRESWLLVLELSRAGAGLDEAEIRRLKEEDRALLPEVNPLYLPFDVTWARKRTP